FASCLGTWTSNLPTSGRLTGAKRFRLCAAIITGNCLAFNGAKPTWFTGIKNGFFSRALTFRILKSARFWSGSAWIWVWCRLPKLRTEHGLGDLTLTAAGLATLACVESFRKKERKPQSG